MASIANPRLVITPDTTTRAAQVRIFQLLHQVVDIEGFVVNDENFRFVHLSIL